jgi:hypothetical protein
MSQVVSSQGTEVVELGVPALVAIGLVMFMSLGTGLGTLMVGPAVLYALSILSCLAPVAGWNSAYPLAAPWLLLLAAELATKHLQRLREKIHASSGISDTVDAAWAFFQCCYGLPWTRRFQDRVNQFSAREKWCVHLTLEGFRRGDQQKADDDALLLPLESFCWVLQRFASEEWITRAFIRFRPGVQTADPSSDGVAGEAS